MYQDGTLLKSSDQPEVWLIQGGERHWIPSPEIFNADGFSWAAILVVSDAEVNAIPQGTDVPAYTTWVTPGPNDAAIPGVPVLPLADYNGAEYKRWRSTNGGHTIYANGRFVVQRGTFQGVTITSNSVLFAGYHSGTAALVADPNGRVLWTSPLFRVGVNPQGLSGHAQVSVNTWSYQVPIDLADQAGGINLVITDSPDNLQNILNHSVGALITALAPAISAIGGILSGSKKSGSAAAQNTTRAAAARRRAWTAPSSPNGGAAGNLAPQAAAHAAA